MRLDDVDQKLLGALAANARLSYRELAKLTGVSTPTAAARVRRLEELGVILGYHARIQGVSPSGITVIPRDVQVPCPECKGPVHGAGAESVLGARHYVFCCKTCQASFTTRFERHATAPAKPKGPGARASASRARRGR